MDERISFGTKDASNARREREFLALSPAERLAWFLRSFDGRVARGGADAPSKGNFIVRKREDAFRR